MATGFGAAVGEFDTIGLTTMMDEVFTSLAPVDTTAPAPINAATETPTFKAVDEIAEGRTLPVTALAMMLKLPWSTVSVRSS
ncbi:hypothetical protein [Sphingomonas cynarae]|uniref:hypothetical protein n=1 Tax=Sphingomonas cynarae TaxID=930197 RepID=UPI0031DD7140